MFSLTAASVSCRSFGVTVRFGNAETRHATDHSTMLTMRKNTQYLIIFFDIDEKIFLGYIIGLFMAMPPPSSRIKELSFCIATC